MELTNALYQYTDDAEDYNAALVNRVIENLIIMLAPMCPFIGEEIWQEVLGYDDSVLTASWPTFEASALVQDEIEIAVQINGVVRSRLTISTDLSKDKAALEEQALALDGIQMRLADKEVRKVIVVPGKLVNIVAS